MNVIAIARQGIGVVGVPPLAIAVARGIAIELVRHAEPLVLAIQVAAADAEAAWLARLDVPIRRVPSPPGIAFAVRVANAASLVGAVLVAEREADVGPRVGAVVRIGFETIELDRRDGTALIEVSPAFVGLGEAEAWARSRPRARVA